MGQSWVGARSLLARCAAAAGSVSTPWLLAADAVGVRGAAATAFITAFFMNETNDVTAQPLRHWRGGTRASILPQPPCRLRRPRGPLSPILCFSVL